MARLQLTAHLHPTDDKHRVTNLELFFDLVFVFALTQITTLVDHEPNATGFARGAVLLAIWFGWTAYSWLGNQARADEGLMRFCMLSALVGMFFVAVAIPSSFDAGRAAAMLLATAYVLVRATHVIVYWIAARGDAGLRHQLLTGFTGTGVSAVLWLAGAAVNEHLRLAFWFTGWLIDFVGVYATSRNPGWRLTAASHFAERFALIVLIAIGESLVSIGVGVSAEDITWRLLGSVVLGLIVAISVWWLYFDVVAHVAEATLLRAQGVMRVHLARDSFTYLHLPIVTGIVLTALGLKFAVSGHHVHGVGCWTLFGGLALYLTSMSALRKRNVHTWNLRRLVAAATLLLLAPIASHLDGLGQLAVAAAVAALLVSYEGIRFADWRAEIHHDEHGEADGETGAADDAGTVWERWAGRMEQ
jgi:low temperature requirement protein LtrA